MSRNNIGSEGLKVLSTALKEFPELTLLKCVGSCVYYIHCI